MQDNCVNSTQLGATPQCVRWMPCTPPGPSDLDGRVTEHKVMVFGQHDSDTDTHFIVFNDLTVVHRGNKMLRSDDDVLTGFTHPGKMVDLQVCPQGGGHVVVLFGTTQGAAFMLRLLVPLTPGEGRSEVQVLDLEEGTEGLAPWLRLHDGAVASLDMHPDTKNILSCGADGRLYVFSPEDATNSANNGAAGSSMMDTGDLPGGAAALGGGIAPFKEASRVTSYTCGRWADSQLFVTSSITGGLEAWDVRQGPTPVARSPREWGVTGLGPTDRGCQRGITCLQVHPSRPNLCASGGSGGSVALWDLRWAARPLALAASDPLAGPVWEVRFDTLEHAGGAAQGALPALLFCTEDGELRRAAASAAGASGALQQQQQQRQQQEACYGLSSSVLLRQPAAINSFDVGGAYDPDLVAVTDRQQLVYVFRRG